MGTNSTIDDRHFHDFVCNVRLNLSDVSEQSVRQGLYISRMNAVCLEEYSAYQADYCMRYHKKHCSACPPLMNIASHIVQEGIVKVSEVYKREFPATKYQSDKAVRRLMQLPVVILKLEHLFVTELRPDLDYRTLINWIKKTMPGKEVDCRLDKRTLKSLCELASKESDRKLIKTAVTWNMSGKQAKELYGIDDHASKLCKVKEAIETSQAMHYEILKLAQLEEIALLRSLGIEDDVE